MPHLECQGLVKNYGARRVVDGVNFYVERGEVVGLLGPNGAGKTTTFRMACGMVTPGAGRVYLNETDVTDWPMYKRAQHGMGYLPQETSVFVKLTVEQNILAILEMLHVKRRERFQIAGELLEQFGLGNKRKLIAKDLSGGEKRRLEIARCLASEPTLILLDEPFTGIDPVTIHSIQDIIRDLRDSGIAILLTDHRERETLTITDRSYIICAGQVVVTGDAETVLNNKRARQLYFGERFDHASIISGGKEMRANSKSTAASAPPPTPAPYNHAAERDSAFSTEESSAYADEYEPDEDAHLHDHTAADARYSDDHDSEHDTGHGDDERYEQEYDEHNDEDSTGRARAA